VARIMPQNSSPYAGHALWGDDSCEQNANARRQDAVKASTTQIASHAEDRGCSLVSCLQRATDWAFSAAPAVLPALCWASDSPLRLAAFHVWEVTATRTAVLPRCARKQEKTCAKNLTRLR
jgi:hypothetical protein